MLFCCGSFGFLSLSSLTFFISFNFAIILLVVIDLLFVSKNMTMKKAIWLTIFWIFLGLAFSIFVYIDMGADHFYEYLSAYFIEKSLSIDNIFVFLLIFNRLQISTEFQHKLLFTGIWSALFLRCLMIFVVGEILSAFHFMMYIFGAFLLFAGISSFIKKDESMFKEEGSIEKYLNVFRGDHQGRFFVKNTNNKWQITIMLVGLIYIEICDIIFAFDSIPALFSITDNRTIIYTSNAFAIIGLRSLYMAFAVAIDKFCYLKYGVGVILSFIGLKMIFVDVISISPMASLWIIIGILSISLIASEIGAHNLKKQERDG